MPPPLAVYVHLPWCERKCPYCDFNSHEPRGALPQADYVRALLADLEQDLPLVWGRRVSSVFIGGGTPSLFSISAIDELLSGLRARLTLLPDAEITLEANPGSSEQRRFAGYREAGVNRLSLGIQSFDDTLLARLGRVHDAAQARSAIDAARAAGFDNFNLDLMYALPQQSPGQALEDLRTGCDAAPAHLSWYQLTLEPNTVFHRYPPPLPDEDQVAEMELAGGAMLSDAGYTRYEVSAWARGGRRCTHNLNYWQFGDYLGIGAGAHGKLSMPAPAPVLRYAKQRQPRAYMESAGAAARVVSRRELSAGDLLQEFMLNALRLADGFEVALFEARTGLGYASIAARVEALCADGLLQHRRGHIAATPLGYRFLNDLVGSFESCAT